MTNRLVAVRERIAAAGLDALLVSDLTNIRWLTGFKGSNGWLVVSASSLVFVTDGRYGEQAQRQSSAVGVSLEVLVGATGAAVLEHTAQAMGCFARVGFESAHLTVLQHEQHRTAVARSNAACELVPVVGVVESCRRSKDSV